MSVLLSVSSTDGLSVSLSVAVLFARFGSVKPLGAVIVAVFESVPVAAAAIVAVTVYVSVPPVGILTVSAILPLPLEACVVSTAPPVATTVYVSDAMPAGKVSVTVAPVTALGPAFEATIVYVIVLPGTAAPTAAAMLEPPSLSVLVIDRSPVGTSTIAIASASTVPLALLFSCTRSRPEVTSTVPMSWKAVLLKSAPLGNTD